MNQDYLKYTEHYLKGLFKQIKKEYGNFMYLVMGDVENKPADEYMHLLCNRIGLDQYESGAHVLEHIRANEHLHDYWAL